MFGQACDQQSQLQYAVAIVTTIVQCCPAMFYAVKRRAGHDSIRLLENENNTCHTSRSNIFLLQHEWKDLFQCLQQADSALRKSMHIVYCTSCATGSQISTESRNHKASE